MYFSNLSHRARSALTFEAGRWRERYAVSGFKAIEQDLPRGGRKPKIDAAEIVRLTTQTKPEGATQWSTRTLAAVAGVSDTSIQRIWKLNTLDGTVISRCEQRHRHVEWLDFLRQTNRETPQGKALHLICDNYATHKHPQVKHWIARHPRFHVHFTPSSASWLNMVERFFRHITTNRLRNGVFRSLPELTAGIKEYVALHNKNPKPFVWTAKPQDIFAKVIRANRSSSSKQNEALR